MAWIKITRQPVFPDECSCCLAPSGGTKMPVEVKKGASLEAGAVVLAAKLIPGPLAGAAATAATGGFQWKTMDVPVCATCKRHNYLPVVVCVGSFFALPAFLGSMFAAGPQASIAIPALAGVATWAAISLAGVLVGDEADVSQPLESWRSACLDDGGRNFLRRVRAGSLPAEVPRQERARSGMTPDGLQPPT